MRALAMVYWWSDFEYGFGGRDRGRTGDLIVANDALSQLSYSPTSSVCKFNKGQESFQPWKEDAFRVNRSKTNLWLIGRAACALRDNLSGVLIQSACLGHRFDPFL